MAKVEIYTTMLCPFCYRAKKLLDQKGVTYTEYDVTSDAEQRGRMQSRAGGRRTVPQIFIDGTHVGGCDELHDLDRRGELDPLLAA
ncbi:MAG: glutaredoxin 3 [Alphaproteobacteria bacterium]